MWQKGTYIHTYIYNNDCPWFHRKNDYQGIYCANWYVEEGIVHHLLPKEMTIKGCNVKIDMLKSVLCSTCSSCSVCHALLSPFSLEVSSTSVTCTVKDNYHLKYWMTKNCGVSITLSLSAHHCHNKHCILTFPIFTTPDVHGFIVCIGAAKTQAVRTWWKKKIFGRNVVKHVFFFKRLYNMWAVT